MDETLHQFKGYSLKSNYRQTVFNYLVNEIFDEEIYNFSTRNKKPVILDIGANIGLSSLYFKELFPSSTIIAFEPDPSSFEFLKMNVRGLDINLHQQAVSNFVGTKKFYTCLESASNFPVASLYKNEFTSHELNVKVLDIADIVTQFDSIDFCKIDVEGEESNIVESLVRNKLLNKVKTFVIEYHFWADQKYNFDEVKQLFLDYGFHSQLLKEEEWKGYKNAVVRFFK